MAVAQLQPGGPVGEGAAVAAHSIGGGAGGDEGGRGGVGFSIKAIDGQQAAFAAME
ncbi:hypothetical protein D9M71_408850 [compost metagenome]